MSEISDNGKLVSGEAYLEAYGPLNGFERICTYARQLRCADYIEKYRPRSILEVGCGAMSLHKMLTGEAAEFESWVIVEPLEEFTKAAIKEIGEDKRFKVISNYLERAGIELEKSEPRGFDLVLLSGILHETTKPLELLDTAKRHLGQKGVMIASVPNANSFHRLLAAEAGLIADIHDLSARDVELGHATVMDQEIFSHLFDQSNMTILETSGVLFKPFTNRQIEFLDLPEEVLLAMIELGERFPEQAAELFIVSGRVENETR